MSINPIDENSTPKTTGSLEELFRHHLGEEAAVPPRPMLWEQIDNSLLVRQNEIYRRRLAATRWVAAASLLLATLAGAGWWARRDAALNAGTLATIQPHAATPAQEQLAQPSARTYIYGTARPVSSSESASSVMVPSTNQGTVSQGMTATQSLATIAPATAQAPLKGVGASRSGAHTGTLLAATQRVVLSDAAATSGTSGLVSSGTPGAYARTMSSSAAGSSTTSLGARSGAAGAGAGDAAAESRSIAVNLQTGTGNAAADSKTAPLGSLTTLSASEVGDMTTAASANAAVAVVAPEQLGMLDTRAAALALTAGQGLPQGLTTAAVAPTQTPVEPSRWSYSASYAASVFNPNINFSRVGIDPEYGYNPALGAGSPQLTEEASAEYRQNLRPGLSQRIALLATRHLRGHWSVSTGAAFAQATARSSSSSAFVGEQLLDLGQVNKGPLRTTDFRYRLASVPVEVRYENTAKKGWSLYGRLGGVVSALLGVRSEVEGNPEATRTYSIASAGTPYRRVLGSLQASAGARYQPTGGTYALTVGPTAELGLQSMNAHPAQGFLAQSRPYSVGLEAGIEFGR